MAPLIAAFLVLGFYPKPALDLLNPAVKYGLNTRSANFQINNPAQTDTVNVTSSGGLTINGGDITVSLATGATLTSGTVEEVFIDSQVCRCTIQFLHLMW